MSLGGFVDKSMTLGEEERFCKLERCLERLSVQERRKKREEGDLPPFSLEFCRLDSIETWEEGEEREEEEEEEFFKGELKLRKERGEEEEEERKDEEEEFLEEEIKEEGGKWRLASWDLKERFWEVKNLMESL